jgi:hypothetical protein
VRLGQRHVLAAASWGRDRGKEVALDASRLSAPSNGWTSARARVAFQFISASSRSLRSDHDGRGQKRSRRCAHGSTAQSSQLASRDVKIAFTAPPSWLPTVKSQDIPEVGREGAVLALEEDVTGEQREELVAACRRGRRAWKA